MVKGNGLKPYSVKSKAEPYPKLDFDSLVKDWGNEDGYFVAYLDYNVLVGEFCGGSFQGEKFEPKFIQKIRLFDKSKELYIWRNDENIFSGRLRIDEEGEDVDVIDAWQALYGTRCEPKDGGTFLTEDRGTNLVVPFSNIKEGNLPIRIHTRNYIGYNELGQAGYEDCRFVEFTDKDKKPLGGD
ncbi:TIGR03984 family CRISPR-associated protein [bacterium]|nr:TIGR03984 family CRISPR-associated protein [bacterium]MBU1754640.1 TIGR03984 family CRISPR-associated protein [bacterium]